MLGGKVREPGVVILLQLVETTGHHNSARPLEPSSFQDSLDALMPDGDLRNLPQVPAHVHHLFRHNAYSRPPCAHGRCLVGDEVLEEQERACRVVRHHPGYQLLALGN